MKGEIDLHRKGMPAIDPVDQGLGSGAPHSIHRDVDCGEHGGEVLGRIDIVDADHRDIPGDL